MASCRSTSDTEASISPGIDCSPSSFQLPHLPSRCAPPPGWRANWVAGGETTLPGDTSPHLDTTCQVSFPGNPFRRKSSLCLAGVKEAPLFLVCSAPPSLLKAFYLCLEGCLQMGGCLVRELSATPSQVKGKGGGIGRWIRNPILTLLRAEPALLLEEDGVPGRRSPAGCVEPYQINSTALQWDTGSSRNPVIQSSRVVPLLWACLPVLPRPWRRWHQAIFLLGPSGAPAQTPMLPGLLLCTWRSQTPPGHTPSYGLLRES